MGNFEKLSVLVIVVIIVMILVVALVTWTEKPEDVASTDQGATEPTPDVTLNRPDPTPPDDQLTQTPWEEIFLKDEKGADTTADADANRDDDDAVRIIEDDETVAEAPPKKEGDGFWFYTVKEGDVLSRVAQDELGTIRRVQEILDLNPGLEPRTMRVGAKLKMPPRAMASSTREPAPTPGSSGSTAVVARGGIQPGSHYVIQSGDDLGSISQRAYGTTERWPEIWARNLSAIPDPDNVMQGARIYLPK